MIYIVLSMVPLSFIAGYYLGRHYRDIVEDKYHEE